MNISKRDLKVFMLGILAAVLLILVFDWGNELDDFKHGFMDGLTGRPYKAED